MKRLHSAAADLPLSDSRFPTGETMLSETVSEIACKTTRLQAANKRNEREANTAVLGAVFFFFFW